MHARSCPFGRASELKEKGIALGVRSRALAGGFARRSGFEPRGGISAISYPNVCYFLPPHVHRKRRQLRRLLELDELEAACGADVGPRAPLLQARERGGMNAAMELNALDVGDEKDDEDDDEDAERAPEDAGLVGHDPSVRTTNVRKSPDDSLRSHSCHRRLAIHSSMRSARSI